VTKYRVTPIDEEIRFNDDEIIVSKTDDKGKILYANDVFCRVAEMTTRDVIGQPHSIIRHPDMPRSVFRLLWDQIQAGEEIFAYVKNMSKSGRYYWVWAHVTPSFDDAGNIIAYHSNRRSPSREGVTKIAPIYNDLLAVEREYSNAKDGMEAGGRFLSDLLEKQGQSYSQFVWSMGA
jgi:PAS domain S-box-containing protein